jgi:type I restriction enzyme, R subunit
MTVLHPDSEDALEQATADLFAELGFATDNLMHETFGVGEASSHGRETSSEVVLKRRLAPALAKLNPGLAPEPLRLALEELCRDRSALSPVNANREVHEALRNGLKVTYRDDEGVEVVDTVRVVDWESSRNNDLLAVRQYWVTGETYKCRADMVVFVNGLPLILIELKASHKNLYNAYKDNLSHYRDTIPQLFWYNAFVILSNGTDSRVGSMTAEWGHFVDWKRINSEGEQGIISLDTMVRGTCEPSRLLDIIESFIVFLDAKGGLNKVVPKNHQYLGVNNAIEGVKSIEANQGRLGVFWHTQGSGKSLSMVFLCQKIMRRVPGNWTFVVVTDRQELDGQIYKTFANTGLVTEKQAQATSCAHLRQLLTEDHQFVFTLIHKFRMDDDQRMPVLSERGDIIVITDEAHRSQYDVLAMNMRLALPNAAFLGFTGTPLIAGEERTRQVFGDYISVYDFKQSIDDGATVPLYYENRIPELQLTNENLNEDMEHLLDEAQLSEEQEKKLEREFSREYHLITRDERLDTIAKDIVEHFVNRGHLGKGMVICIDRFTAVRMYDKVQEQWAAHLDSLRNRTFDAIPFEGEDVQGKIPFMEETDMAVVVSVAHNEGKAFADKGLDIMPHRKRLVSEDLETKFKDANDPLRLVFVCAMWVTGFDVPSCSTIYLDKPMRNHTLMQTIARANRVFPEKNNGLIVDYAGIFRNLQKALAIYGSGRGEGDTPIKAKEELVKQLRAAIAETVAFCRDAGVDLDQIQQAAGFERTKLKDDAVDALLATDERKRTYLSHANYVDRLYKAVLPDAEAQEFGSSRKLIIVLAEMIRAAGGAVDISDVMADVDQLLDESIAAQGYVITAPQREIQEGDGDSLADHMVDLSQIDFDALRQHFDKGRKHTTAERLKAAIARKLQAMVRLNRTRMDYLAKFQKMIDEYNAGSQNIEHFFAKLTAFAQELSEEEQRTIAENLSEEELALFDLLTKPEMTLSRKEEGDVKKVAGELLGTLKQEKLVLDWRKRQQSRASVRLCVEEILDQLPRSYTPEVWQQKCDVVYQHVYDSYFGSGRSVYAMTG